MAQTSFREVLVYLRLRKSPTESIHGLERMVVTYIVRLLQRGALCLISHKLTAVAWKASGRKYSKKGISKEINLINLLTDRVLYECENSISLLEHEVEYHLILSQHFRYRRIIYRYQPLFLQFPVAGGVSLTSPQRSCLHRLATHYIQQFAPSHQYTPSRYLLA